MESAFRKKVEKTIAQSLAKRVRKSKSLESAAQHLTQLRQLVIVNDKLRKHLRDVLLFLKDAEFVDAVTAADLEKEWKELGGRTDPSPKLTEGIQEASASRSKEVSRRSDTTFKQLLQEPTDIYDTDPQEPWNKVDGEELEGFLDQIDPIDGHHAVDTATTQVAWSQLPFYDGVALIRVVDKTWSTFGLVIYYLSNQGNLFRLNGTSPPIHEVNAKAPLRINEDSVLDYLRFFCFFVHGDEGPFYLAEDLNDPYIPRTPNDDDTIRLILKNNLKSVEFEKTNEQGKYLCNGLVFYSNALFFANFAVQPTGMIEMLGDEPVAGDLPVKMNAPLS